MKYLFLAALMMAGGATTNGQSVEVLTGTQSGSKILTTEHCYHLQSCYIVDAGDTLTINAGVTVRCAEGSSLVIKRGAFIYSNGTAMSPVVFTSDKAVNSRGAGDWIGIVIAGSAKNNVVNGGGGDIGVQRCGVTYNGGGTDDADNSGVIRFTRIEFAGGSATGNTETNALDLVSVGSGTQIHDVQISESGQDAFWIAGGTVNLKDVLSLNAHRTDFRFTQGNRSNVQFGAGLRMATDADFSSGILSNGIVIESNPNVSTTNAPFTHPALSNMTILDPSYCGATLSSNIQNGILVRNNGQADIFNSAISQYGNVGFFIDDAASVGNTANNTLNFSFNALLAKTGGNFGAGASWATGCGGVFGGTMSTWINGTGSFGCEESGNSFSLTDFGYSNSICNDYCSTPPTLTYSGTHLNGTLYPAPFNVTFFDSVGYKGAIGGTDWTSGWAEYCPQEAVYCSLVLLKEEAGRKSGLYFVPNPSSGMTIAYFETDVTGAAELSVLDPITGMVLRRANTRIRETGKQQISFSVKGLKEGVYPVRMEMSNLIWTGQIVVR